MKFILSILTLVLSVALAQKFAQVRQSLYLSKDGICKNEKRQKLVYQLGMIC
ncbi:hypothetical protein HMPREF9019_1982 [Hoylesella timonensis CRIS 5C-B1]|uniref:Uncharacterized protein n=1 Tax=Hoylesella timonensis CRIS 5C-B1 TaxID=679189 RepID=D1VXZ4_9BACT|nr:hypothetical protein HMPREF9019_1982 [Hoylesella timonensis CRIS 5C-B1]